MKDERREDEKIAWVVQRPRAHKLKFWVSMCGRYALLRCLPCKAFQQTG
jgi:hypothetical protein